MICDGLEWGCGHGVESELSYVSFEGILLCLAVLYCCKGYFFDDDDETLFGHGGNDIYWDDHTVDVRRIKYVKEQLVTKVSSFLTLS